MTISDFPDPIGFQNHPKTGFWDRLDPPPPPPGTRFWPLFGPFWDPLLYRLPLESQNGRFYTPPKPDWEPQNRGFRTLSGGVQFRSPIGIRFRIRIRIRFWNRFWNRFWIDFQSILGPIYDRFMIDFMIKLWSIYNGFYVHFMIMIKFMINYDRFMIDLWSIYDQFMTKLWSILWSFYDHFMIMIELWSILLFILCSFYDHLWSWSIYDHFMIDIYAQFMINLWSIIAELIDK